MPAWHDQTRWQQLVTAAGCPICLAGQPDGIVAELKSSYVTVDPAVGVRGYCCLVNKRHVVELHELSEAEGAALMLDLALVSRVLKDITGAIKINHQIHGNTIPHLHVHVIPRYPGDELEQPGKTLGTLEGPTYSEVEMAQFTARLRDEIELGG